MIVSVNKLSEVFIKAKEPITRILVTDTDTNDIVYVRGFKTPVYAFRFNLPKGNYNVKTGCNEMQLIEITKPFFYKSIKMPEPTKRQFKTSKKITSKVKNFKENGSPASINVRTGMVVTNKKFDSLPKYARDFILAHEEGHLRYKSEKYADLYALNKILSAGGNYSPCLITLVRVLGRSPVNMSRLHHLMKVGKQIN